MVPWPARAPPCWSPSGSDRARRHLGLRPGRRQRRERTGRRRTRHRTWIAGAAHPQPVGGRPRRGPRVRRVDLPPEPVGIVRIHHHKGGAVKHVHAGKVRDLYELEGGDLLLVASDRVSVYDVVLPTPIPDKGKLLTQLSLWWFEQLADVVAHHVISGVDVPDEWAGRAIRCRRLNMIGVECIARGYLAGLGLREYQASSAISGVPLPPGLV